MATRGEKMAAGGEDRWPRLGRNRWPLTGGSEERGIELL